MEDQYTPLFHVKDETYTSCYCEENIYKLCEKYEQMIQSNQLNRAENAGYAVFITNPFRKIFIDQQKKGDPKVNLQCIWDYHVIFIHKVIPTNKSFVYDFDSIMPFPSQFDSYFLKSLFKKYPQQALQTMYRIVDSATLLKQFASNRDHMVKKIVKGTKVYNSPPPQYPPIENKSGEKNNLFDFYLNPDKSDAQYGNDFMNEMGFNQYIKQKEQKV